MKKLLSIIFILLPTFVYSDILVLKNGTTIDNILVWHDDDSVHFYRAGVEVAFPLSIVDKIIEMPIENDNNITGEGFQVDYQKKWEKMVMSRCQEKWPKNYRMQKHCFDEEVKAFLETVDYR